jgi:hypothetical protein
LLAGGPVLADQRCPSAKAASGLCAPVHFVDGRSSREERARNRAYERGYRDALNRRHEVAPPPAIALDGKEGYSQGAGVHRQYLDRGRYRDDDRRRYRRHYDRDDYYERRLRRSDRNEAADFATQLLRGLAN